ncbi:hypothetical protein NBRC116601_16660 [Cognatishimia sp. WU-CL00825]|uniref:formylglycine-generating enzyme family protein n=1 Tax=Cognatishimia sp. WU-CL00825 TaxID=3127658 RepID=UPI003101E643
MTIARKTKTALGGSLVLAVIAAIVTVAKVNQPADLTLVPEMAKAPVILADGRNLHVQKYEVTIAEWNLCHAAGACSLKVRTRPNMDPRTTPATGLNFVDVGEYLAWINAQSNHPFRLPSMQEWDEFAADVLPEAPGPLFTDPALSWASAYLVENLPSRGLKPTGSFPMSKAGISDLTGSVWEWTQDCYDNEDTERCAAFYVAGEHAAAIPFLVRDPARGGCAVGAPPAHLGLRLVSDKPVT